MEGRLLSSVLIFLGLLGFVPVQCNIVLMKFSPESGSEIVLDPNENAILSVTAIDTRVDISIRAVRFDIRDAETYTLISSKRGSSDGDVYSVETPPLVPGRLYSYVARARTLKRPVDRLKSDPRNFTIWSKFAGELSMLLL